MRFNEKKGQNDLTSTSFPEHGKIMDFDTNRLVIIDTLKVDGNARLTLTKRVRDIFPIMIGDTVGVLQDKYNADELLFKIQRDGNVVDNWVVKRKYVGGIDHKKAAVSSRTMIDDTITTTNLSSSTSNTDTEEKTPYVGSDDDDNSINGNTKKNLANIMLIDDEQDVLYSFKSVLSTHGYYVKTFL